MVVRLLYPSARDCSRLPSFTELEFCFRKGVISVLGLGNSSSVDGCLAVRTSICIIGGPSAPLKSGLNRYNMIQSGIESIQFRMVQGQCPPIMQIGIRRRRNLPLILQIGARWAPDGRQLCAGHSSGRRPRNRPSVGRALRPAPRERLQ